MTARRSKLKRGVDADPLRSSCQHTQSFCATARCGFFQQPADRLTADRTDIGHCPQRLFQQFECPARGARRWRRGGQGHDPRLDVGTVLARFAWPRHIAQRVLRAAFPVRRPRSPDGCPPHPENRHDLGFRYAAIKRGQYVCAIDFPGVAQTFRPVRFNQRAILVAEPQFCLSHSQLLVIGQVEKRMIHVSLIMCFCTRLVRAKQIMGCLTGRWRPEILPPNRAFSLHPLSLVSRPSRSTEKGISKS